MFIQLGLVPLIAVSTAIYLFGTVLLIAVMSWLTAGRPHLFDINGPVEEAFAIEPHRPFAIAWEGLAKAVVVSVVFLAVEIALFERLAPQFVPGLTCGDGWALASNCQVSLDLVDGSRSHAFIAASASIIALLLARLFVSVRVVFPLIAFVGALILFSAVVDLAVPRPIAAQGEVVLGSIGFLQLVAAMALFGAVLAAGHRGWVCELTVVAVASLNLILRVSGAIAVLLLSQFLPAATAIAIILVGLMLPAVGAAMVPIAIAGQFCSTANRGN